MNAESTEPALGVYVHLPWCESKCPYCDFNSYALDGALPAASYVDALIDDIDVQHAAAHGRSVTSIFIGGGTPSLFPAESIERILRSLRAAFRFSPSIEVTLEANPGSVELDRLDGYRAAGVNRLSIGVQSFDADALAVLGRRHSAGEAAKALGIARAAGFDNVNLDLMYALPGQTVDAALADVERLLDDPPEHVSWYQLTLEPGTRFHRDPPPLPDDDQVADIQEGGLARLTAAGFERYEVSAFARSGRRCRHNLNYWRFGDYLAFGAGAHGKLTAPDGWPARYERPRHPRRYQAVRPPLAESLQPVAAAQLPFEFFLNTLRLVDGHRIDALPDVGDTVRRATEQQLSEAERRGLLERPDGLRFRPSALGFRFLNDLQALFLP
ncbi:MAG: radical SAM family heme chaperone HemW [Pseudomonadota bacterium]